MKDRLTSGESFIANCSRDPDFFHFCMNHIPARINETVIFYHSQVFETSREGGREKERKRKRDEGLSLDLPAFTKPLVL